MIENPLHILSFASKNPERQAELKQAVAEVMSSRPFKLSFAADESEALELIESVDILLAHRITPELFSRARQLNWIHLSSAGVEKSIFPEIIVSEVQLTNSRDIHAEVMSEWTAAALYYISQRFDLAERWRRERSWDSFRREIVEKRFILGNMSALIVGYGAVGQPIARRLNSLGIKCEAVATEARTAGIPVHAITDLDKIIGRFDIVVIALPWTTKTDNLFDATILSKMKAGGILVNLARGRILDQTALIENLKSGHLSFAALDVFSEEPLPVNSELFSIPNLFMTPHISGNFPAYTRTVHELFVENLKRFVNGEPLKFVVDKQKGY